MKNYKSFVMLCCSTSIITVVAIVFLGIFLQSYALIGIAALVGLIILFMIKTFQMRKLTSDWAIIDDFLTKTANGYLDDICYPDESNEFKDLVKQINTITGNYKASLESKELFLSRISHELKTPLNAIMGMTRMAKESQDRQSVYKCIDEIEVYSRELITLVSAIIDYSQSKSDKAELNMELFSLKEGMSNIMQMFKGKATKKGIKLHLYLKRIKHDGVCSDRLRLEQVIVNLLTNALANTDFGGRIDLIINELMHKENKSVYTFTVSDNGQGMDEEHVKRLFTPFTNGAEGSEGIDEKVSLGLAISKNIVELLGGEIEVDTAPGIGSTFSFALLLESQENATAQDDETSESTLPTSIDLTGKRLLIVDDYEINREITKELMLSTGVEMEEAEDGKEALDLVLASEPYYYDFVFMDLSMPNMDGFTATEKIRNADRDDSADLIIIAMSANTTQNDMDKAMESGMDSFIAKPIEPRIVYKKLNDAISQRAVRQTKGM